MISSRRRPAGRYVPFVGTASLCLALAGSASVWAADGLSWRQPLRVTVKDGEQLRTDQMISDLMGKDVAARFKMITENAADIGELDV